MLITAARLRELVDYNPETGVFIRLASRRGDSVGKRIGTFDGAYLSASVGGKSYRLHRLAWLYVHGVWPKTDLDHVDGDKLNCKINNLREAPQTFNQQNRKRANRNSVSGFLGAHKAKHGMWRARIRVNGVETTVGYFKTASEAGAAYLVAKAQLHPFGVSHG